MRLPEFLAFIEERHNIFLRRESGMPKPWTEDNILQSYRFCNVYRENDTVTKWIRDNWREPYSTDPYVWFAMVVARLVNWPHTLNKVGYPAPWNEECGTRTGFMRAFEEGDETGKCFSSAYIVSTNGHRTGQDGKEGYLRDEVLNPLWAGRTLALLNMNSLKQFHTWLMQFNGMGSFMAAQVVCDTKYTPLLKNAPDWWTWSAPGPGSLRGMSRVMWGELGRVREKDWVIHMSTLLPHVRSFMLEKFGTDIHAQDVQNCLCEFDKYERVRLGEGRPRQKYEGV